ncbi:MAG: TRAP transporter small permease subunit [Synergistetes bacterium]|nr:TRAP transporter small permease subunit [Synergistota bacterium]MCX8127408.1 TRAP transporter small permease subunit [Synergistota bacterium]MDW8192272.1 TRAP transporter small permease [Synergistota bacterium]
MKWLGSKLNLLSALVLGFLTALICIDVILRLFRYPIPGSYDIAEFLTSLMLSLAILKSFQSETQIKIDLIDKILSKHKLKLVERLSHTITTLFLAVLSISMVFSSLNSKASGEVSMTLGIPLYLSYAIIGICVGFALINGVSPLLEKIKLTEKIQIEMRKLGREKA